MNEQSDRNKTKNLSSSVVPELILWIWENFIFFEKKFFCGSVKSRTRESGCNFRFNELNGLKMSGIGDKIPIYVSVNFQPIPLISAIGMVESLV